MNQLIYLKRSLLGEFLKYKNTLAFYLAICAPAFIVVLNFFIFYFKGDELVTAGDNPWILYSMYNLNAGLAFLFPLYIILITVLINYVEHANNSWKHIYALALPKWTVYTSKFIFAMTLVGISMILFGAMVIGGGKLLGITNSELLFQEYTYAKEILLISFQAYLASMAILAIQFWLSFRWNSVILPVGIGMAAFITSIVLQRWEYIIYYPYSYPFFASIQVNGSVSFTIVDQTWYGLAVGTFVFVLGMIDANKKDII